MNRIEKAKENHKNGYNCSQAVACAFCDEVGIDEKTMFALTEGFGLGLGDMQGTCGAISGAAIILSMKNSCANPQEPTSKAATYTSASDMLWCVECGCGRKAFITKTSNPCNCSYEASGIVSISVTYPKRPPIR